MGPLGVSEPSAQRNTTQRQRMVSGDEEGSNSLDRREKASEGIRLVGKEKSLECRRKRKFKGKGEGKIDILDIGQTGIQNGKQRTHRSEEPISLRRFGAEGRGAARETVVSQPIFSENFKGRQAQRAKSFTLIRENLMGGNMAPSYLVNNRSAREPFKEVRL